jgi:hypothetical protein
MEASGKLIPEEGKEIENRVNEGRKRREVPLGSVSCPENCAERK